MNETFDYIEYKQDRIEYTQFHLSLNPILFVDNNNNPAKYEYDIIWSIYEEWKIVLGKKLN